MSCDGRHVSFADADAHAWSHTWEAMSAINRNSETREEPTMQSLADFRVAVLATDGFEESELTSPVRALREAGADVTIVSLQPGQIQGFKHDRPGAKVKVDCLIGGANPEDFDAVLLPGGTMNADAM